MKIIDNKVFFYSADDVFSNHYLCDMEIDGIVFNCVEQYMMYKKAMLFNDDEIALSILNEKTPKLQKALGRQVRNFDQKVWDQFKCYIVYNGCFHKFLNPDLEFIIKKHIGYEFVEASATDALWGIGLAIDNEDISSKEKWRGQNLLGKIITEIALQKKKSKRKDKKL